MLSLEARCGVSNLLLTNSFLFVNENHTFSAHTRAPFLLFSFIIILNINYERLYTYSRDKQNARQFAYTA